MSVDNRTLTGGHGSEKSIILGDSDYLSIDAILAENERVPCRFDKLVPKLGMLDASIETEDITAGTKLELPLWIVKPLLRQRVAKVEVPKHFREMYREILQADATVVDLSKICQHFYKLGLELLKYSFPDGTEISKILIQTFQQRARKIMDVCQNPYLNGVDNKFTLSLDQEERNLFQNGLKALNDFQNWQSRKQKIVAAEVIENHKKRKRASCD